MLGAGASAEAGVPTANAMTEKMAVDLHSAGSDALHRALMVIAGGLQMGAGWEQTSSLQVDIERVINVAHLLANRFDAELAPFVGNWHPVLDEIERRAFVDRLRLGSRARIKVPSSFSNDRQARDFASAVAEDLSSTLEGLRQAAYRRADGQLFEDLRTSLTLNLVKHTWLTDIKSVEYLAPLVRTAVIEEFPIVTLNFDNSIELCAESMGVECREMFSGLAEDNQGQSPRPFTKYL